MRISAILLILTSIFLFLACPAWGQEYTFIKVVDLSTQRTDGNGLFAINSATTPAFDGQWVVLRDNGNRDDGSLQAIWSFDTKTAKLTKLVDLHTVQPGGTATFYELHLSDTAPAVRNSTVVFLARSAFGGSILEGIYAVSVEPL